MSVTGLGRVIEADRKLIDAELRNALRFGRQVPTRLARAMRYSVMGPGKRVRSILALETFRAAGGRDLRAVLPFCCGIEFIHTFSLIHDDLPSMDDDDLRRGRPSLHRAFDEATAILAADGLFAYAFEVFAASSASPERRLAAIDMICRAVGPAGMTGGQMMDITGVKSQAPNPKAQSGIALVQRKKTAEFIAAALVAGAILGGASAAEQRRLHRAGLMLGMLFQITDDLLDTDQAGEENRLTMVSVHGRDAAARRAKVEAARARRLFDSLGPTYRVLAAVPEFILHRKS